MNVNTAPEAHETVTFDTSPAAYGLTASSRPRAVRSQFSASPATVCTISSPAGRRMVVTVRTRVNTVIGSSGDAATVRIGVLSASWADAGTAIANAAAPNRAARILTSRDRRPSPGDLAAARRPAHIPIDPAAGGNTHHRATSLRPNASPTSPSTPAASRINAPGRPQRSTAA